MEGFENVEERLHQTARFHRGHLHGALLGHVPVENVKLGKKISEVNVDEGKGVEMVFEDGTSATADLVIGADGIRSVSSHFDSQKNHHTKRGRACELASSQTFL